MVKSVGATCGWTRRALLVIAALSLWINCVAESQGVQLNAVAGQMQLLSAVFAPQAEIPRKYTCQGQDVSPPLSWSGLPSRTKSLALIVDDPDAPDPKAPKMTWVHWVVFNIPATASSLSEGVTVLPTGAREGINDFKRKQYGGPCPPIGRHRYFFKLYALDTLLTLEQPTKTELEKAMSSHILAQAKLIGTYQKATGQ